MSFFFTLYLALPSSFLFFPPSRFPSLPPLSILSFFFFQKYSYGPLGEVLPYLLRRALENSQMLSSSSSSSSSSSGGGVGSGGEGGGGQGDEAGKKKMKEPASELDAVRRELKARAVAVFFPRDK